MRTVCLVFGIVLVLSSASSAAVGPSFDCSKARAPLAQLICADPALSRADLLFNQAYWALYHQTGASDRATLKGEDARFLGSVQIRCGIPRRGEADEDPATEALRCVRDAYNQQRLVWMSRLAGPALEEASRPIERHIALKAALEALGFVTSPAWAAGVYGPATRTGIEAWQRTKSRTPTGFLSDSDALALENGAGTSQTKTVWEAILVDGDTGQVLRELNADFPTEPGSLAQMMTLYLTFEALNQGRIRLDTPFTVSSYAASRAPSKLALGPGETVSAHELILGVITKSANDAATVLAEGLGGSEANFAQMMNAKAHQLGMQQTFYRNASGLLDPEQRTTARDIARLSLALYHNFPKEYRYFATAEFHFHGELIQRTNRLLNWYPGADGIEAGSSSPSAFGTAASALRNGHRLIAIILGSSSETERDQQMGALLDQGFVDLSHTPPAQKLQAGKKEEVPLVEANGVYKVPVLINGVLPLQFVVDSGAGDVSIPADVFSTLRRTGTITAADYLGKGQYKLANGSVEEEDRFTLHALKVGNTVLQNITASVGGADSSLLLGQSFLKRFSSVNIDNDRHVLVLGPEREGYQADQGRDEDVP